MTDREKAIVMAHTGVCMLTGKKFQIFHKYIEDLMGHPIFIHELGNRSIEKEIKEKSKADFLALCAEETGQWRWRELKTLKELGSWYCSNCGCIAVDCVRKEDKRGLPWQTYCPECGSKNTVMED